MKAALVTAGLCLGFSLSCHAAQHYDSSGSSQPARISEGGSATRSVAQARKLQECLPVELPEIDSGRVVYIDRRANFFIIINDDGEVYRTDGLIDEIREDDKVEFNLRSDDKGRKGYNAVNVKVIG